MRFAILRRQVLAVLELCDARGNTPIHDALLEARNQPGGEQIFALLNRTSIHGPPLNNKSKCRFIGDKIFEFKAVPSDGPGIRVLWFYGGKKGYDIICTHWFTKGKNLKTFKRKAIEARRRYIEARNQGVKFEIIRPKEARNDGQEP